MISPGGLLLMRLIRALLTTEILELLGALVLGVRGKREIGIVVLVNIVTNVPLNLTLGLLQQRVPATQLWGVVLVGEIVVVLLEGGIYMKGEVQGKVNPWILSLLLNAFSYVVGTGLIKII